MMSNVRCTSRAALLEANTAKARGQVLAMMLTRTDWIRQEVADALGWTINRVTPRVLELIKSEAVEEAGFCRKTASGRSANVIRVKHADIVPSNESEGIARKGESSISVHSIHESK